MTKSEQGFSAIEGLLVVIVLGVLVGLSYVYFHHKSASLATNSASQTTQPTTSGTSQSIDNLAIQEVSSQSTLDNQFSSSDQATAQSANGPTANLGGAYNESSF
ncbi:MAG TPA: hypothetical protein VNE40_00445 [Candidatus Dormibacteraeota bacterium]|nr:hypothetical protein [Candidatus Dormibacteraeota bacterium]